MKAPVKEKVTVSLDPALVEAVDQDVQAHRNGSRSAVMEDALRLWQLEQKRHAIEQGVAAYYRTRTRSEQRADRTWSRLASRQARQLWDE